MAPSAQPLHAPLYVPSGLVPDHQSESLVLTSKLKPPDVGGTSKLLSNRPVHEVSRTWSPGELRISLLVKRPCAPARSISWSVALTDRNAAWLLQVAGLGANEELHSASA